MNKNNVIKYDHTKIVIYTHPEIESFIGIPMEKVNNIRQILRTFKEDSNQKSEEEVEGNIFYFNERDGYYESNPNDNRNFKIIELKPEMVRISK